MIRALVAKRCSDGWIVADFWIYPNEVEQVVGPYDILLTTVPMGADA